MITETKKGYKKTKLGWIPEEWDVIRLGDFGEFKNGINKGKDDFGFGVPFINLMDVFGKPVLKIDNWDLVNANESEINNYSLKKGDVLFIRSSVKPSGVGLTSVVKEDLKNVVYSGFLIRYRQTRASIFDLDYLQYCFYENKFRQSVIVRSSTSANTNINQDNLKELKIPLPPLPEQQKIATIFSTWDKAIDKLTQLIAAKEQRKKGLMQVLLTGKKRFAGYTDEWKEVKLETVAKFKNGKGHENDVDENGEYVLVNSKFVASEGKEYKMVSEAHELLKKGTIVMVMSDVPNGKALAKCFLINEDNKFTLNQRICSLTSKGINTDFLLYQLNRNKFYMKFDGGVGQTNLKKQEVLNCPVLLPNKEEQQKIASVLSIADKEIELLKKELESLQQQKKGLMQVLLTGEVRVKI